MIAFIYRIILITYLFLLVSVTSFCQNSIELVESVPVETDLDNPDIRCTQEVWLEMINAAKRTIDMEQFYISNQPGEPLDTIIKAIIFAAEKGVKIRIIVDSKMYKTYPETVNLLNEQKNIRCRIIDIGKIAGGVQHAKYFILDRREIFIGSQNFDWRALKHIHELGVRIESEKLAKFYLSIFIEDWEKARNSSNPIVFEITNSLFNMKTQQWGEIFFTPTLSSETLIEEFIISPHVGRIDWNAYRKYFDENNIISIMENTDSELLLQFLTYSPLSRDGSYYSSVDSALYRAGDRGVKVKLLVSDWNIGGSSMKYIQSLDQHTNIEVRYTSIPEWSGGYIPYARVEHCKFIVSDEKKFWLGSSNMEKSYFYNSRNIGIVIENTKLSEEVRQIFYKSWESRYAYAIHSDSNYTPRFHGEK